MNGKIKTKFAALFAVALMITVCVVPVVGNDGTDAAPVSSSNGEVFEGYDITLYKEGGDYSGLVYHDVFPSNFGLSEEDWTYSGNASDNPKNGYWVNKETKKYMTVDDVPGYVVIPANYGMPMIQFVYGKEGAEVNTIHADMTISWNGGLSSKKIWDDRQINTDNSLKTQGIKTVTLKTSSPGYDSAECLGLEQENWAGDFVVEIEATQGVTQQVINETVNAGPAVTVSGQITDADGKGIVGTVTYGSAIPTDENGKYSFNVVPGSVVGITVAAPGYTFKSGENTWNFGDVNTSVTKNFKAVEKTGTITVQDANGNPLSNETVTLAWYYQVTKAVTTTDQNNVSSTETTYVIGNAPQFVVFNNDYVAGTATASVVTGENGKATFAYTLPKGTISEYNSTTDTVYSNYTYALVVKGDTTAPYTFDVSDFTSTSNIQSQINSKAGMADAQGGSATITAIQSTGTITVQSANGNPIAGETVTLGWYYQVTKAVTTTGANNVSSTVTTYIIQSMPIPSGPSYVVFNNDYVAGTATASVVTGENGKATFAYTLPKGTISEYNNTTDTVYSNYTYALVASAAENTSSDVDYTYDEAFSTGTDLTITLSSQISNKNGIADAQSGSATIKAEQNSFKISGTVEGYSAEEINDDIVSYKLDNADVPVILQNDGTFTFYVIEGEVLSDVKIVDVSSVFDADLYTDKDVSIGTVYQDVTVDFKLKVDPVGTDTVKYRVAVPVNTIVTFTYSIDGEKYTADVKSSASNFAELTITANMGAQIEVSAVAEGYNVPAFVGYSADAKLIYTKTYKVTDGDNAIPGATFGVTYSVGGVAKIKQLKADENGYATFSDVYEPLSVMKDGNIVQAAQIPTWTMDEEGNEITYYEVDLGSYYEIGMATMNVVYAVAYNSDTVTSEPVGVAPISGTMTATNNVVVGNEYALKAPSIDNFEFVAWMVDGVVVSESADYTFKADKVDTTYEVVALYSAVHYEEPAEGLSMNVLVIGIVILILGILAVAYGIISKKQ